MSRVRSTQLLLAAALLSGCASEPMGPTVMVMPAAGKPFEMFAQDQSMCKKFADGEVDGGSGMSNLKGIGTAAISTVMGAGLGAALHGGYGAGVGGAAGAAGGSAMAGFGSGRDQKALQGRYDIAYTQCMYSHGNQIAGAPGGVPRTTQGVPGSRTPVAMRQSAAVPSPTSTFTYGAQQDR